MGIKSKLLHVAQTRCKNLQVRTVGQHTQDTAGVGMVKAPSLLGVNGNPVVTHRKINVSVGAHGQSMYIVPIVGSVHPKAAMKDFLLVRQTIRIGILQSPDIRINGKINLIFKRQYTCRSPVIQFIEPLGKNRTLIGHPVPIGILQPVDPVFDHGQVPPIMTSVPIVILQPGAIFGTFFWGHPTFESIHLALIGVRSQVLQHPRFVRPNIDINASAS